MYLIKIKSNNSNDGWWKALLEGDPGITLIRENATKFGKKSNCVSKIKELKRKYPNHSFNIELF